MAPTQLPVIEFPSKSLISTSSSWMTTCSEVMRALEEHGAFVAIYDGLPQKVEDTMFLSLRDLFGLPTETKLLNTSNKPIHGRLTGIRDSPFYESFGIENALTEEGVDKFTKRMWPSGNDTFSKTALMVSKALAELEQIVMLMLVKTYGMEEHYESLIGLKSPVLRLLGYLRPPGNEGYDVGLIPHTDKTFFTVLRQEVKGLEIETKEGEWIEVDPLPSSFIVFAGDACKAWTNGRIKGANHRVNMNGHQERFALGLFMFINGFVEGLPILCPRAS